MCRMPALQGYWQRAAKRREASGNLKKRKAEEELEVEEDEDELQIVCLPDEEGESVRLEEEIQIDFSRERREAHKV